MTDEQAERLIAATERAADNLAVLAYVTGKFDVGTELGVEVRDAVQARALAALGIDQPAGE